MNQIELDPRTMTKESLKQFKQVSTYYMWILHSNGLVNLCNGNYLIRQSNKANFVINDDSIYGIGKNILQTNFRFHRGIFFNECIWTFCHVIILWIRWQNCSIDRGELVTIDNQHHQNAAPPPSPAPSFTPLKNLTYTLERLYLSFILKSPAWTVIWKLSKPFKWDEGRDRSSGW